jgi:hypothetical protein
MSTNRATDLGSDQIPDMAGRRREAVIQLFAAIQSAIPNQHVKQTINNTPIESSLPILSAAQDPLEFERYLKTSLGPMTDLQSDPVSPATPASPLRSTAIPTDRALTMGIKKFKVKEELETYYAKQETIDYIS